MADTALISGNTEPGPLRAPPPPDLTGARAAFVILGLFLAILMAGLDSLVVTTALPKIAASLHQVSGITFVASAYLITSTISIPIFSKLADRYSRRNVFLVGLGIFIVGSALSGLSQDLNELIAFRGVQGFGTGGFIPVAIAMVAVLFPPETRARLTGLLAGAGGIAIVVGPLLGSYIVDVTTWRWVFYVNLPIGIASAIVLLVALEPLRPERQGRFDVVGAGLLSGWVAALMFALIQVTEGGWAWTYPGTIALLALALIGLGLFVAWELRRADPLVPLRLMGRRVFAASGGIALFNGVVFTSVITFLSVFVGIVLLHEGPGAANDVRDVIYFFAVPLILGAFLSGLLLSRFPYRTVLCPSLAVAAGSAFFLAQVSATTPLWVLSFGFLPTGGLVLPLIPMGFGGGVALAGVVVVIQNEISRSEVGAAVGFNRFLQSLGGAVGLSLLTAFQTWRLAVHTTSASGMASGGLGALVASYDDLFFVLAVLMLAAFLSSLFLRGRIVPIPKGVEAPGVPPTEVPV
jgi:EmrB/QacA subfamily drug resistance transporter